MVYGINDIMTTERKIDVLVFVIGLLSMVKVRFMGTFALGELLVFALTPFVAWREFVVNKRVKHLVQLAFLWLIGVLISDFWNQTPITDCMKGAFNVVFVILLIPFVYWCLYQKTDRFLIFFVGNSLSALYNFYYQRVEEIKTAWDLQVWLVYAYYPLAMAISGLLYYRGNRKLSYVVIVTFGIWTLFNYSRNIILCQALAVVILLYVDKIKNSSAKNQWWLIYNSKLRHLAIMLFVGAISVDIVYETLAEDGTLGERVYEKYMYQKNSKDGLVSGRADALVSLYAISRNPIMGYGSYAVDKYGLAREYHAKRSITYVPAKHNLIPGHSYILGAWVYSGILGLFFFVFVLRFLLNTIRSGWIIYEERMLGVYMFLGVNTLWNIFFSPFVDRIVFVFFIISMMCAFQNFDNEENFN